MDTKKPLVYSTHMIPNEGLSILNDNCVVKVSNEEGILPRSILLEEVRGVDGILCFLTDVIDREAMEAAGNQLRVISNFAAGYDNIDVEEATRRGILVTNTPGVLTETTADLAWALLMAIARRVVEGDKFVREGKFRGWNALLFLGTDVHGATLGIIGLGRIGQAMVRRAQGFNMKVIYYDQEPVLPEIESALNVSYRNLHDLLSEADFISIHVPLTDRTFHLIGEKELKLMKKESYLINTSRGPVIDEKALFKALREEWIRGAALDVFENEPEVEPGLLSLDNVILVPHIGSASYKTRSRMAIIAAENLVSVLRGEIPEYLVNPEVLRPKNE